LKRHRMIHTRKRPNNKCNHCGRFFFLKSSLTKHMQRYKIFKLRKVDVRIKKLDMEDDSIVIRSRQDQEVSKEVSETVVVKQEQVLEEVTTEDEDQTKNLDLQDEDVKVKEELETERMDNCSDNAVVDAGDNILTNNQENVEDLIKNEINDDQVINGEEINNVGNNIIKNDVEINNGGNNIINNDVDINNDGNNADINNDDDNLMNNHGNNGVEINNDGDNVINNVVEINNEGNNGVEINNDPNNVINNGVEINNVARHYKAELKRIREDFEDEFQGINFNCIPLKHRRKYLNRLENNKEMLRLIYGYFNESADLMTEAELEAIKHLKLLHIQSLRLAWQSLN